MDRFYEKLVAFDIYGFASYYSLFYWFHVLWGKYDITLLGLQELLHATVCAYVAC